MRMAYWVLRTAQARPVTCRGGHLDRPRADHSRALQTLDLRQQIEGLVFRRVQGQRRCVHPHGGPAAGALHVEQAPGREGPALGQQIIARLHRELPQRLARADPLGRGQPEEVAGQGRQPHAVVQPPQRPRLARLLHGCGIQRPHLEAPVARHIQTRLIPQCPAQRMQPSLGFPQPLPDRCGGQLGQLRFARTHCRLPQRVAAPEMQQQYAQQVLARLVLAQPLQRPRFRRQFALVRGQELDQQVTVSRQPRMQICILDALVVRDRPQTTQRL